MSLIYAKRTNITLNIEGCKIKVKGVHMNQVDEQYQRPPPNGEAPPVRVIMDFTMSHKKAAKLRAFLEDIYR